jgi:predicted small secreted protein
MNKPILFMMIVAYVFLTGCANTLTGMREDIAKPFVYMGKVGEKIQGKSVTDVNDEK